MRCSVPIGTASGEERTRRRGGSFVGGAVVRSTSSCCLGREASEVQRFAVGGGKGETRGRVGEASRGWRYPIVCRRLSSLLGLGLGRAGRSCRERPPLSSLGASDADTGLLDGEHGGGTARTEGGRGNPNQGAARLPVQKPQKGTDINGPRARPIEAAAGMRIAEIPPPGLHGELGSDPKPVPIFPQSGGAPVPQGVAWP